MTFSLRKVVATGAGAPRDSEIMRARERARYFRSLDNRSAEQAPLNDSKNRSKRDECWVYFIECAGTGSVKIGFSDDVLKRLAALQAACPMPLVLLAKFPGGPGAERELHRRFDRQRIRGEWFRYDDELEAFVTKLKESESNDPIRAAREEENRRAQAELEELVQQAHAALSVGRRMWKLQGCHGAAGEERCSTAPSTEGGTPTTPVGRVDAPDDAIRAASDWIVRRADLQRLGIDPLLELFRRDDE